MSWAQLGVARRGTGTHSKTTKCLERHVSGSSGGYLFWFGFGFFFSPNQNLQILEAQAVETALDLLNQPRMPQVRQLPGACSPGLQRALFLLTLLIKFSEPRTQRSFKRMITSANASSLIPSFPILLTVGHILKVCELSFTEHLPCVIEHSPLI